MKANELRIGNLVNYKYYNPNPNNTEWLFTAVEIVGINQSTFIFKHLNSKAKYKIEELHPIPLTEEWLLKMGFKNDGICIGIYEKKIDNLIISIVIEESNLLDILLFNTNITCVTLDKTKFKYVNQLQNLYFALTNQELEITNK
jgi:hypothetical protein